MIKTLVRCKLELLLIFILGFVYIAWPNKEIGATDVNIYGVYVKNFPNGFGTSKNDPYCFGCIGNLSETNHAIHPRHMLHQPIATVLYCAGNLIYSKFTAYNALQLESSICLFLSAFLLFKILRKYLEIQELSALIIALFCSFPTIIHFSSSGENYALILLGITYIIYIFEMGMENLLIRYWVAIVFIGLLLHTLFFLLFFSIILANLYFNKKINKTQLMFNTFAPIAGAILIANFLEYIMWKSNGQLSNNIHANFDIFNLDKIKAMIASAKELPFYIGSSFYIYDNDRNKNAPLVLGITIIVALTLSKKVALLATNMRYNWFYLYSIILIFLIIYQGLASTFMNKYWYSISVLLFTHLVIVYSYRVKYLYLKYTQIFRGVLISFIVFNLVYYVENRRPNQEYGWTDSLTNGKYVLAGDTIIAFYGLNVDAMYFYTNTLAKKVYYFSPSDLNNIKEIHNNLHEIRNSANIYLAFQYDAKVRDSFLKSNNIEVVYENKSNNFILGRIKE